jgi:hypothetical protein
MGSSRRSEFKKGGCERKKRQDLCVHARRSGTGVLCDGFSAAPNPGRTFARRGLGGAAPWQLPTPPDAGKSHRKPQGNDKGSRRTALRGPALP